MATFIIRGIDQTKAERIDELAEKKGISREEYMRRVINDLSVSGELKELESKYESLVMLLGDQAQMMNDVIEKNSYVMEKILQKM